MIILRRALRLQCATSVLGGIPATPQQPEGADSTPRVRLTPSQCANQDTWDDATLEDRMETALGFSPQGQEHTKEFWRNVVASAARTKDWELLLQVTSQQSTFKLSVPIYNAILKECNDRGDHNDTLEWWKWNQEKQFGGNSETYTHIVQAMAVQELWEDLAKLREEKLFAIDLIYQDPEIMHMLIAAYCGANRTEDLDRVMSFMLLKNVKPAAKSLSVILRFCKRWKLADRVDGLRWWADQLRVKVSVSTQAEMIGAYGRARELDRAQGLVDDIDANNALRPTPVLNFMDAAAHSSNIVSKQMNPIGDAWKYFKQVHTITGVSPYDKPSSDL
eukprot:TRINITY_DN66904_c2_g3_i1.p1 TRINITY_DN66904_c2_g3~~TRINITY_DN66904_c2_g3_i1.p1  ORF type:complete len:333 (+),score=23.27 TRINITY_DN66904_c2_g3_i1:53-1051(+)